MAWKALVLIAGALGAGPWVHPALGADVDSDARWAFAPLRDPTPPVDESGRGTSPIDGFVAAGYQKTGLSPTGPASRLVLIRRLSIDLVGLPPSPEEIAGFLEDESPDAVERLIERLLASPAFGERQGRRWMDVVRYADTAGDNADYPIPEGHLYRDYIIDSFNSDKPYGEFVREQIAGDLLAEEGPLEKYAERIAATGFIALSRRYATAPFELMHLTIEDTIETTGRTFLGLTLRCARCHDHKHDPVTTRDYYGLYGVFASTRYPFAGSEEFQSKSLGRSGFVPLVPRATAEPRLKAHEDRIRELSARVAGADQQKTPEAELKQWKAEIALLRRTNLPPDLPGAYAVQEGSPTDVAVQWLGDPGRPGPVTPRGAPRLPGCPEPPGVPAGASGRRQLAEWITSPAHPLTSRVLVNRVWQAMFGRGLVATASDFGARGDPPTHPELLDWLASRLIESGGSIKSLFRLIASSRTYQLSSSADPEQLQRDPGNRWLARHDRRRLDAEALRDCFLTWGGDLDLTRPGEHPFPPISTWAWTQHSPFKAEYATRRRSVYLMTQRIQRHSYCGLFDGPDTNTTTASRTESTVPQQALFLLNGGFVEEEARSLARRLLSWPGAAPDRIAMATRLVWGRPPLPDEPRTLIQRIDAISLELAQAGAPQAQLELEAWASFARALLASNEALHVD